MKHHYMPQFLLRPWRGKDGKVAVCYRPSETAELSHVRWHPRSTGYVRDLYRQDPSFRGANHGRWEQPHAVEIDGYQRLDSDAATIRDKFLEGVGPSRLSAEERTRWAEFIATLEHRTLRQIAAIDRVAEAEKRKAVAEFEALGARGQELLQEIDVDALSRNVARSLPVNRKADFGRSIRDLTGVCFTIDGPLEFITADYPLAFFEQEGKRFGLVLPLSPKVMYIAAAVRPQDVTQEHALRIAIATNLQLIYQHPNYLYSRERLRDGPLLRLETAAAEVLEPPDSYRDQVK